MVVDPSIGLRIKHRREELGISQAELARRCHVNRNSVWNWEKGLTKPSRKLEVLALTLNRPPRWIVEGVYDTLIGIERNTFAYYLKALVRTFGPEDAIEKGLPEIMEAWQPEELKSKFVELAKELAFDYWYNGFTPPANLDAREEAWKERIALERVKRDVAKQASQQQPPQSQP
jgi:transcriptional regulator with XRE-family HTH domain